MYFASKTAMETNRKPDKLFLIPLMIGLTLWWGSCSKAELGMDSLCQPAFDNCTFQFTVPAVNHDTIIEIWNPGGGIEQYPENVVYQEPVFNPSNPNEIIYIRIDIENLNPGNFELWKFNFCTGEAFFITDFVCCSLDWSVKDWILFTGSNFQLYKIKSNGDSLTQLTFSGDSNSIPSWGEKGNSFAFRRMIGPENLYLFANEDAIVYDTLLKVYAGEYSWDGEYITYTAYEDPYNGTNPGIWLHSRRTDERWQIQANNYCCSGDSIPRTSISLFPEYKLFWSDGATLNYTDMHTGERTTFLRGANNRQYEEASVSPTHQAIAFNRIDYVEIDHFILQIYSNIYLVDADGQNERKVVFPE